MEFAFDGDPENENLPHNFSRNCIVYGGTHDNETLAGYFSHQKKKTLTYARDYLNVRKQTDIPWGIIGSAFRSTAPLAVFQMQDYLGLDNSSRINTPSTVSDNWKYRFDKNEFRADDPIYGNYSSVSKVGDGLLAKGDIESEWGSKVSFEDYFQIVDGVLRVNRNFKVTSVGDDSGFSVEQKWTEKEEARVIDKEWFVPSTFDVNGERDFSRVSCRLFYDGSSFVVPAEEVSALQTTSLKDKFSLLENVRALESNLPTRPTLSIGLAYDENDVNKLNSMAEAAINIALSRGGDQVVVSQLNHDLLYFGGKTEAKEEKNKVGVRAIGNSLFSTISAASNVLVMGHDEADMDAIGSCLGILSMCLHIKKECQIIYDKKRVEKKAREAFSIILSDEEKKKWTVDSKDALEKIKNKTLLIVVDVHRPSMTMCPKAIEKAKQIVVIDHHRRSEEFVESPVLTYVDSSASSASELVTELIHYTQSNPPINIPTKFATLMLSGIYLDTNFFKSGAIGERTFEACMFLKNFNADSSLANEWLKDDWAEQSLITQILSTQKFPYNGIIYCTANEDQIVEQSLLAKVANQCLQIKDINACFVIGKIDETHVKISCRSNGSINVQLIAEKLGGGGHLSSAAVTIPNFSIAQASTSLINTLSANLQGMNVSEKKGE